MTQEDKELSFIDISGRLHYGVIVNYKEDEYDCHKWKIANLHTLDYSKNGTLIDTDWDGWINYEENKGCGMSSGSRPFRFGEVLPYLRPLSSMTEEEVIEFNNIPSTKNYQIVKEDLPWDVANYKQIDWLLKHHFDFRGLIPKGLAIAVTTENNPYKTLKA